MRDDDDEEEENDVPSDKSIGSHLLAMVGVSDGMRRRGSFNDGA